MSTKPDLSNQSIWRWCEDSRFFFFFQSSLWYSNVPPAANSWPEQFLSPLGLCLPSRRHLSAPGEAAPGCLNSVEERFRSLRSFQVQWCSDLAAYWNDLENSEKHSGRNATPASTQSPFGAEGVWPK